MAVPVEAEPEPGEVGHVVVAGMGQVGVRLAQELRALGVAVVGIEQASDAPALPIARDLSRELIRVVTKFGDEKLRTAIFEMLKAANDSFEKGQEEQGTAAVGAEKGDPFGQMKLSSRARAQAVQRDATALLTACGLALRSFD